MIKTIQIPNGNQQFYLNRISLEKPKETETLPACVSHIFICDCSGSMSYDLPQLRKQLCNEISSLVKPGDDVTIIWFSGRDQAGIVKKRMKVSDITQLTALQAAIEQWLRPVGLTGFAKPIDLCKGVLNEIKTETPDNLRSMIFLTDGGNNDSPWEEVTKLLTEITDDLSASSYVEYGNYADSARIKEMAEITGGRQVFCENFNAFEPEFRSLLTNGCAGKRINFSIAGFKSQLALQMVFQVDKGTGSIITHSTRKKDAILVPENTTELFVVSTSPLGEIVSIQSEPTLALTCFVPLFERMMYDWSEPIVYNFGDEDLLGSYVGAYGKQKLNEFKKRCLDILFNGGAVFTKGYNPAAKPNEKAYCIIDVIDDLTSNVEENRVYPLNEAFSYTRIGAKTETKVELSEDIKKRLAAAKTKREADEIMREVEGPEFEIVDNDQSFPLSELVWNESRANLSFRVKYNGVVKLPKNSFGLEDVPSFIYRTYTIIKDGILNIKSLPVSLDKDTHTKLVGMGLTDEAWEAGKVIVIHFGHLPIINRSMVQKISAVDLANLEYDLIKVQAAFKVLNHFNKLYSPKTNTETAKKYSEEAAKWLQSIGVTEYNGFSPKVEKVLSNDVYQAPVLETKIQSLSGLPKVEDVQKKRDAKKPLTVSESLVLPILNDVEAMPVASRAEAVKDAFKKFNHIKRHIMNQIAGQKFSLILSRRWFKEFKSFDENELTLKFDSQELKVKFDYKEETIEL